MEPREEQNPLICLGCAASSHFPCSMQVLSAFPYFAFILHLTEHRGSSVGGFTLVVCCEFITPETLEDSPWVELLLPSSVHPAHLVRRVCISKHGYCVVMKNDDFLIFQVNIRKVSRTSDMYSSQACCWVPTMPYFDSFLLGSIFVISVFR